MYTLNLIAGFLAALPFVSAAQCNANNCLRQVRATAFPSRTQDCSSFLVYTSTPVAFTTVTTTVTAFSFKSKRSSIPASPSFSPSSSSSSSSSSASIPPRVPTYASSCTDVAAYVSACICIGVNFRAVTASTTTTSTITRVSTVPATASPTPFYLTSNVKIGSAAAQPYIAYVNRGDLLFDKRSNVTKPQAFVIDPSNDMVLPADNTGSSGSAFFYYAPADRTSYPIFVVSKIENSYPPVKCRIEAGKFICKYRSADGVLVLCTGGENANHIVIARDARSFGDSCTQGQVVSLTATPA